MGTRITEDWLLKNGVTRDQIDSGDPHLARRLAESTQPAQIPARASDGSRRGLFIEIAGIRPPSVNEVTKGKLREGIRLKESFFEAVASACSGLPPATGKRRVSVLIELPVGRRAIDPDNAWKYVNDGLKNCGQIRNDSKGWVELGTVRFLPRSDRLATTIFLEDL